MGKLVTIKTITQFGNILARNVRKNLAWSNQLSKAVILGKAKESGEVVSITISVGEKKKDKSGNSLAGMARAYEYGSGIHSTRGSSGKYVISPRLKKALWFYMDNPNPNIPLYIKDGKIGVVLQKVLHPGVKARPFLRPAVQETLARAAPELRLEIRKNLIGVLNTEIRKINNAK